MEITTSRRTAMCGEHQFVWRKAARLRHGADTIRIVVETDEASAASARLARRDHAGHRRPPPPPRSRRADPLKKRRSEALWELDR